MDTDPAGPADVGGLCACVCTCVCMFVGAYTYSAVSPSPRILWASGEGPSRKGGTALAMGGRPHAGLQLRRPGCVTGFLLCGQRALRRTQRAASRSGAYTQDLISGLGLVLPCGLVREAQTHMPPVHWVSESRPAVPSVPPTSLHLRLFICKPEGVLLLAGDDVWLPQWPHIVVTFSVQPLSPVSSRATGWLSLPIMEHQTCFTRNPLYLQAPPEGALLSLLVDEGDEVVGMGRGWQFLVCSAPVPRPAPCGCSCPLQTVWGRACPSSGGQA